MPEVVTDIFAEEAAPAGGPTILDLSKGTEKDPNSLKGVGTSLGATSTLVVAANHGSLDGGLDAYVNIQDIGAIPSGKDTLVVQIRIGTKPTSGPTSGTCYLTGIILPTDGALAVGTGYYGGGMSINSAATTYLPNCEDVGAAPGSTAQQSGTDPMKSTWVVHFRDVAVTPSAAAATALGSGSSGGFEGGDTDTNGCNGTFSTVWLGIALCQTGSPPGAAVTYTDVVVSYEWM
jgi:hypothetical protein